MQEQCVNFLDELSSIVDGDEAALDRHLDHLSDCDDCRDARHEADRLSKAVGTAGDDFVLASDFGDRVLSLVDDDDTVAPEQTPSAAPATPESSAAPKSGVTPIRSRKINRSMWIAGAAVAAAAAAVVAVWTLSPDSGSGTAVVNPSGSALAARLVGIERAAQDGVLGIEVRAPGASEFSPATKGMTVEPGSAIRTDERTRVRLALSEGTEIFLNHLTEVSFDAGKARQLTLSRGELVADVAKLEAGPNAIFALPHGQVEVLGTRFLLSAAEKLSSVRVTRGLVTMTAADGSAVQVRPGEEGVTELGKPAAVAPTMNLASALGWSEVLTDGTRDQQDDSEAGIGELRAYKPGEKRDRDWPMVLETHKVSVRIVGNVARTEIEETFRNDSDVVLEGVYKFPLPADASIDKLALDVDGKFEEGAFVAKDRAAKIWRGVIQNAAPKIKRRPKEEIIWVPGPWRDPALLEWKRGGRFELKIFPIPKKGSRTVKIAYTQTIEPEGNSRRYVYPLAHSKDGSTAAEKFDIDVKLSGIDSAAGVRSVGYDLQKSQDNGATRMASSAQNFVPKGNLVIEYKLPNSDAELRAWTFAGAAAVAPGKNTNGKKGGVDKSVVAAQKLVALDQRPYVLMALKPELPRWSETRRRDYVIVVDSSQSMVGERFTRATKLITALVSEMDRGDQFTLLACDLDCQSMGDELSSPSAAAAGKAAEWLGNIEPAGASHLSKSLSVAAEKAAAVRSDSRDAWVLYVGDGMASIGSRNPGALSAEVTEMAEGGVSFSSVGIGADADSTALEAIARGGGGHFTPYTPGRRIAATALSVLETTYGVSLKDAVVTLPSGLSDIAPTVLPTVRAGNEILVAARFSGDVSGNVVLKGTVGGKPYENSFPVKLEATTSKGNAFVPRLWAAQTIGQLELSSKAEDKTRIIGLSKAYGVMSRHTSLLVLESEKMFKAFGVDRTAPSVRWTGDEDVVGSQSSGVTNYGTLGADSWEAEEDGFGAPDDGDALAVGLGSGSRGKGAAKRKKPRRSTNKSAPTKAPAKDRDFGPVPAEPTSRADRVIDAKKRADDRRTTTRRRPPPRRGGMWMKKVWIKTGSISKFDGVHPNIIKAVGKAESSLADKPDSRERHRALVQALSYAGEIDRAYDVAKKWHERDRMDPQALIYMSDLLGRQGKRDEALRRLSGIVDIRPDDQTLQLRMAKAFDRAGKNEIACAHRVAISEVDSDDAKDVAAAMRCLGGLGKTRAAARVLSGGATEKVRDKAQTLAGKPAKQEQVKGQLVLDANWIGATDIDLTIITPQGTRLSWMGGRKHVVADNAGDIGRERLGLRRITRGNYLIEVSRADASDKTPVKGTIEIKAPGSKKTLNFELDDERKTIGRVRISSRSEMRAVRGGNPRLR